MTCTLFWQNRGVLCDYSGTINGHDRNGAIEIITANAHFTSFRFIVEDFSKIDGLEYSSTMFDEGIALLLGAYSTNARIKVCVITSDKLLKNLFGMHMAMGHFLHEVRMFNDILDAYNWVDLSA